MTKQPDGQELQGHGALRQPEPQALGMCWQLILLPRLTSLSKTTRNPDLQIQRRNLSPPKSGAFLQGYISNVPNSSKFPSSASASQTEGMNEQADLCPPVGPMTEPLEAPLPHQEVIVDEEELDIDPESVIEEAEMLLREGAPHDFDVIVIGAGPGGLACATHLAQNGQSVALIERGEIGGVCLNRGCIPTKTLLESVATLRLMRRATTLGVDTIGEIRPDFKRMQERKREVVANLRSQSYQRAEEAGVQLLQGTATLEGDRTIEFTNSNGEKRRLSSVHIVLAVGGTPSKPGIEGVDLPGVLTSDEILDLEAIPRRLIVLGAGAVGIEFATIFAELGTRVYLVEKAEGVLPGEDEDIQNQMEHSLQNSGIEVNVGVSVTAIEICKDGLRVTYSNGASSSQSLEAEIVLVATGRRPNIENLGLDRANIEVQNGIIRVEEDGSTSATGVWAIGDCIRRVGWAHQAAMEGHRVANAILGFDTSEVDSRFVPSCYYTFPEVASVGMALHQALERGMEAHIGRCAFRSNGRANAAGESDGFVKLVVETATGTLLGAQIIGPRATELINEVVLALRDGATAERLADALHTHPTFAEVLPGAARDALRNVL